MVFLVQRDTAEQTQAERKKGSECLLAWLQKWIHQPRIGSITVLLRLQVPLSLRADEAEGRSKDFPNSWSYSLPLALILCVSSERSGRRQSVLVGCFWKVAEWMTTGEAPGLIVQISDVCAVLWLECCNGETVPSMCLISWFPKTMISLAKENIATNLRLIWHFAGVSKNWWCLSGQAVIQIESYFCSLWRILIFFKQKWY